MDELQNILPDRAFLVKVMKYLFLVRKFEEQVFDLFGQGKVHGTTHLGIGEEATGVGSVFALESIDYVLASHRGHGQVLAKGSPPRDMMAEILAKEAGINRGRGGSMHLSDLRCNVMGMDGILGAACPIACGIGLSFRMKSLSDRIVAVFFGDGSMQQGAVHEAFNLAAAWRLPVLFICTDNGYGMSTPLKKIVNDTDLSKRAVPYGIKSFDVDGNDVLAVYRTVRQARSYIIENQAPAFVVEHTYRTSGHSKSDGNQYRTKEEIAEWKSKNPLARFIGIMLENGFNRAEIDEIERDADAVIAEAVAYAESCPNPSATPEALMREAYAGGWKGGPYA
ncbi:MAG: thiamine pyrophosphate-dependent dehydrogenase E1 component subunit alpha [Clostridiales Family XIII bacterium]|nr:thiamine pyrophosphate-dependent dehydrogenase E1 component subunit alpha [Clostridiales Family XIII bacterium]